MQKKNIAVVYGGYSSENVVSRKSAQGVVSFLDPERYNIYPVEITADDWLVELPTGMKIPIDKNDFSFTCNGEKAKFALAYITIHGTPGENGLLQGYFDMVGVPYSCCGVLAAAVTFNKYVCNQYLSGFGFHVAKSMRLLRGDEVVPARIVEAVGLPCFIKPNQGGSSFGTTKVKSVEEVQAAVDAAFAEDNEVVIESFLAGTEVSCGCFRTLEGTTVLPITEVVSKNEFFDYEAKYTASKVEEITPARIPDEQTAEIQRLTARIYDLLGCKGIIRADYIIVSGTPYLLEVNTTPGMTPTSFIPQQVRAAGLDIRRVMTDIIETELARR
ncbi:MAG: D-alanine--D-alanine ligase [Coprobacter sp.]|nr:D-alanine--D-alanine ligase [Coprobacter sp.]